MSRRKGSCTLRVILNLHQRFAIRLIVKYRPTEAPLDANYQRFGKLHLFHLLYMFRSKMAEGENRISSRRASEQSLQGLDTHSTTKQEAIDVLEKIIRVNEHADEDLDESSKKLLKCLLETENKQDLLSPAERSEFVKIVKSFKGGRRAVVESLIRQAGLEMALGIHERRIIAPSEQSGQIAAMEENLISTKIRLQDALDRINILNQDLAQLRSLQSNERRIFENDLADMRDEKTRERRRFEDEIRKLKDTITKLEDDKHALERQIKELRLKMEEEKVVNERFKQEQTQLLEQLSKTNLKEIRKLGKEQDEKMQTLSTKHAQEIGQLNSSVGELIEENRRLRTRDPYKLAAHGVTLVTNALYKHVHNRTQLGKNYYSIDALEDHLETAYDDEEERSSAVRRWDEIKNAIGWNQQAKTLISQLAENRERGTRSTAIRINYEDFSEAIRIMLDENELDQEEARIIRDLFANCNATLHFTHAT